MTEAEFLAWTDPYLILNGLRGRISGRKLRLLALACCRPFWDLFSDWRCRRAIEVAELFADGRVTLEDLSAARVAVKVGRKRAISSLAQAVTRESGSSSAYYAIHV